MRGFLAWSGWALLLGIGPLLAAEPVPENDTEVWNAGVEYFRQGDVTNTLRVLRPLMLSKEYGARAAEVIAKLELERGNQEEAARASQIALRAAPADAKANRNFTRATDGLLAAREQARIQRLLQAAAGKDPGSMLQAATYESRALMTAAGGYRTNEAVRAVALADSLSKRAEQLADTWVPVRQLIAQSVTNEEQAATIMQQLDNAARQTRTAAGELEDLKAEAFATLSSVEHDFTRFFKLTAMPPAALGEGLIAQSNAWQDVEEFNGRAWQRDALEWTQAFRAQFPAWARNYEQQAQSNTNLPPFTAEAQAKVSALASELEKVQLECCEKQLPPEQEKALNMIREIQGLLPKDPNSPNGQPNPQPQPEQSPDSQKQDQQGQQPEQDQQPEQPQSGPEQNQQDQSDEKQGDQSEESEAQAAEAQESEADPKDEELDALLKKAQERNDEHEADKKARMRKAPLPPNEKDW